MTGARFNMKADVLRQNQTSSTPTVDPDDPTYGEWVDQQDPLTHEIVRIWVPAEEIEDDPDTPINERVILSINCIARGITDGGIRVAGTTERWGSDYESVDYVHMWFPANVIITKRDRVTNIRNNKGVVIWKDEEIDPDAEGLYRSTVFEVTGVIPIPDPFGNHIENMALLERAEVSAPVTS